MYQKIIVPIDYGNRNMKTEHKVFTSGFVEGDCRPALGEYLHYNERYYALAEQRIPYMRDKTVDDRFFILTLFAVAMEAEKQMLNAQDTILQAVLPVGLPPKHYGALYRKFEDYFRGRGIQRFTYKGIPYKVEITDAAAFPQDYAAAMTVYQRIAEFNKVITVDIGGFTLDYLLIRGGRPDLGVCDSLEKGVIKLYNDVASRINSEKDILLDDTDIDRIIRGERTDYDGEVLRIVGDMTRTLEMGAFDLFPSPKKLYAYFGLNPAVKQSGKFNGAKVHISKRGSSLARRILHMVALNNLKVDKGSGMPVNPVIHSYYADKCKAKKKNVAVGAVMHKICNIIFAMLRDNKPFEIITPQEHCERYLAAHSDKAQSAA